MTHDDRYLREDVRVTRDETGGASSIVIGVVIALLGLGLLYWVASSYWAGPSTDSTTIINPAPLPATPPAVIVPPADTPAPAPLNNEAAPPATDTAPAPAPEAPAPTTPAPAPSP
jgi:hypothetical protein